MNKTKSQPRLSKFDKASFQLLFNIFLFKPDATILPFIKKYFPNFLKRPTPGGWIIYPSIKRPKFYNTIHSVEFNKHPYFKADFREGRFDILTQEEEGGRGGIRGFRLWFMFDTEKKAKEGFKILCNRFSSLSKSKKIVKEEVIITSIYSSQPDIEDLNRVVIILLKDELYPKKYKIYFDIGGFYLEEAPGTK